MVSLMTAHYVEYPLILEKCTSPLQNLDIEGGIESYITEENLSWFLNGVNKLHNDQK